MTISDLQESLSADEQNIPISIEVLKTYGLYNLYEQTVPELFDTFLPALERTVAPGFFPFTRKTSGGGEVPSYDFILRIVMILSAREQFVFALGHLLRGHSSEISGHLRRAIESAGIAYLSKSKPELGDLFIEGDAKKFRNVTPTRLLFPSNDALTSEVRNSLEFASSLVHNNLISFASRVSQSLKMDGTKWTLEMTLKFYGETTISSYLRIALWVLRAMERILRLFAVSFDLSDANWLQALGNLKVEIDKLYIVHDELLRVDLPA